MKSRKRRKFSRQATAYGYRHYIKGKSHEVKGYEPAWYFPAVMVALVILYIVAASQT